MALDFQHGAVSGDDSFDGEPSSVSILEVLDGATRYIPEHERVPLSRLARLTVRHFEPGELQFREWPAYGIFVLDGYVLRETPVGGRALMHLLGRGDLVDPPVAPGPILGAMTTIRALTPVSAAILPGTLQPILRRWPALYEALLAEQRALCARLETQAAISHFPRVDLRILALLWHLASTHGRVTREGVVLDVPMTHSLLGRFIGARRPTVSLGLGELTERGVVQRGDGGRWLLPTGSEQYLAKAVEADDMR